MKSEGCSKKNVFSVLLTTAVLSVLIFRVFFSREATLFPTTGSQIRDWMKGRAEHLISSKIDEQETAEAQQTGWDSLRHTAITRDEIEEKLQSCKDDSIRRYKECKDVHRNPIDYWRSVSEKNKSHADDIARIELAAKCCAFNFTNLIAYNPRDPLFPWEREYLSDPPIRSLEEPACGLCSSIKLLNDSHKNFTIGDKIVFEVVLRNGTKEKKLRGGDHVRVWLDNGKLGAAIACDVIDLNNGRYLATTVLPWAGKVKVHAAIAHTRELFRVHLFFLRIFKLTRGFFSKFSTAQATEITPCFPFPAVPGYEPDQICNMTSLNGGFPWYCGRPVKSKLLNCSHSISIARINTLNNLPMTSVEDKIWLHTKMKRPFMISSNIVLTVKPSPKSKNITLPVPQLQCNRRNMSLTFEDSNQSGYFFKKAWRPMDCQLPEINKKFMEDCLRNTQMIVIGDSNARKQINSLQTYSQCVHKIDIKKAVWHAPMQCDIESINASIKYYPHKHPFYGSSNEDLPHSHLHSSIEELDAIPRTGKYIVLLHHFLHMTTSHLSVLEIRLRLLRDAIKRLLARNPSAVVIYQSAHTAYEKHINHLFKVNPFVMELHRGILNGLGDRVLLALTWPITIAAANADTHPTVKAEFTRLYMGYICGRPELV